VTVDLSALVLPDRSPPAAFFADVLAAEAYGVRTVWTYDHLSWPLLHDGPWYGCVPLLAAAAALTSRVRLGTQVASPNFRHPVPFAKELMTLDQISGGRLEVGVGVGAIGPDSAVLGEAPLSRAQRTDRFEAWLVLLDRLLRDPITTATGEWYSAVDARQMPGSVQQPRVPLTVAAAGPRALALCAAFGDAWVTYGPYGGDVEPEDWFTALATQSDHLNDALDVAGRERGSVRRIAQFSLQTEWPFVDRARYDETARRLATMGFDEIAVHWPRPDGLGMPAAALEFVADVHRSIG
jgi:alkanesulfonate monooxygenase SsuD/methylene tetrahydromethanopterin reductase-like flavin-dependent oxidoreductase (luciferase family)